MSRCRMISVWVGIVLFSAGLLMGRDCPAQTDLCVPDPCEGIANAEPGTCTPIPGGMCQPDDFACQCSPGYTWHPATHTCVGQPLPGMAQIPAGCFDMGDSSDGCYHSHECPVHNVCISAFEMDVYEVTNAKYAECVAAGGCTAPSSSSSYSRPSYYGNPAYADFPVIYVNWFKASAYCAWTGKRLPTEAEWEYAARGGLEGKRYPWGDTISGTDANYSNSGDPWDNDTSPVGHYAPNGYGLYDMAGNVWEWTNDWYGSTYYQYCVDNGIVDDPPGPATGSNRVLRGGSWAGNAYSLRAANRAYDSPANGYFYDGFRCAR